MNSTKNREETLIYYTYLYENWNIMKYINYQAIVFY
jgi:hypothetical protein